MTPIAEHPVESTEAGKRTGDRSPLGRGRPEPPLKGAALRSRPRLEASHLGSIPERRDLKPLGAGRVLKPEESACSKHRFAKRHHVNPQCIRFSHPDVFIP